MSTYYYGSVADLTSEKMVNIYLYGTEATPEGFGERLRSASTATPTVQVDGASFMTAGGGRFASMSQTPLARILFEGQTFEGIDLSFFTQFSGNTITVGDLKHLYGVHADVFRLTVRQHEYDPFSNDYNTRSYIFGGTGFTLSDDTEIDFTGSSVVINNAQLRPYIDNFDYVSENGPTDLSNGLSNELVDPYLIGRTTNIEFTGNASIPRIADGYGPTEYSVDLAAHDASHTGTIFDGFSVWAEVSEDLYNGKIFDYVTDDERFVVFGTSAGEGLSVASYDAYPEGQGLTPTGVIIVAGDGADGLFGTVGDDSLYGGNGNDALHGDLGDDFLDGGDGDDVLKGGKGNDLLLGGEGSDEFYASTGVDIMLGQGGNDTFHLRGWDAGFIVGGAGNDIFEYDASVQPEDIGEWMAYYQTQMIWGGAGSDEIRVTNLGENQVLSLIILYDPNLTEENFLNIDNDEYISWAADYYGVGIIVVNPDAGDFITINGATISGASYGFLATIDQNRDKYGFVDQNDYAYELVEAITTDPSYNILIAGPAEEIDGDGIGLVSAQLQIIYFENGSLGIDLNGNGLQYSDWDPNFYDEIIYDSFYTSPYYRQFSASEFSTV